MSVEIAWKQNILITDFYLLKSLLGVLGLVRRHSSVDSADKTLTVYFGHQWLCLAHRCQLKKCTGSPPLTQLPNNTVF